MRRLFQVAIMSLVFCVHLAADDFGEFEIEFVTIGAPGNLDRLDGVTLDVGSVENVYRIGKYEISREQFEAANIAGGLGLTVWDVDSLPLIDELNPTAPATDVSFNEIARFVNWLNTASGVPPAYKFEFQPGEPGYSPDANILLWEPDDAGYDPTNLFRNSFARYILPSQDEWFKAAYYNPKALDNGFGGYTLLPEVAPGNLNRLVLRANLFEDIHSAGSESFFGTFGMAGNAEEIIESAADGINDDPAESRIVRGGNFTDDLSSANARHIESIRPFRGRGEAGFRVASIPEPSALTMTLLPLLFALHLRRRTSSVISATTPPSTHCFASFGCGGNPYSFGRTPAHVVGNGAGTGGLHRRDNRCHGRPDARSRGLERRSHQPGVCHANADRGWRHRPYRADRIGSVD